MTAYAAYAAILGARFRTLIQYRAAALAGLGTQLFWGLIRVMILDAFYRSTRAPQPMSQAEMVTYVWLGQALLTMLPWNTDPDVRALVRTGGVAYELLRPLDLYALWYTRAVALRTAPMILRALPLFVVAGLFIDMGAPPSWASFGAWLVSMVGALALSCAITTLISVSLLWTVAGEGLSRLLPAVVYALSGMLIPLPLFPDWAQTALALLPFRGVVDAPYRVYMGHIPPEQIGAVFAHQALWTAALVLAGRMALNRAARRLVVQGG